MENLSLFEMMQNQEVHTSSTLKNLDVVKLEYAGVETLSWQELFDGYSTLHAITYSSGVSFVCKLLDKFSQAEIIFGNQDVMSETMQEIMAYQSEMVQRLKDNLNKSKQDLLCRIEEGSLRFYVARKVLSHEKIYLLEAEDGRKRVIMGSANMSFSAFGGVQRENICYIDGDDAYNWYMGCYETLRDNSTDEIVRDMLVINCSDNGDVELPIARTVRIKKAIVVQPVEALREEVRFALDVRNLADKFKTVVPKQDKKGRIALNVEKVKIMQRRISEERQQQEELRSVYPELIVYPEEKLVRLNGEDLDLNPAEDAIRNDVSLFLRYMDGYKNFHGDAEDMQRRYYEFANWFFCTPFMATMRNLAVKYNQKLLPYPVFGLIYGQSKAGKTSFLETLLKMMIGQKPKMSAPDFTRSQIEALKRTVKGAPIIVDDLTNTRFNQHAIETIKNDDFGVADGLTNYPAIVISANEDVKAVAPEVIRRTVICRVQAGLTNTEVMKSSVVRSVQRKIGTAFYREYLRRMLEQLPDLMEEMKDDETESPPDILKVSADILLDILKEYTDDELPFFARELSLEDYFSEKVTGSHAIKTIQTAWRTNRKAFEISTRTNELRYNAGAVYEADRIVKELPENLEAKKSRDWIVMNLEEAKSFFGIQFKKSIIPWL